MKVEIHSIQSLEQRAHEPFAPNTALISIDDYGTELPELEYEPSYTLRVEFDDFTRADNKFSGHYFFRLFSEEQAEQIADFVCRHWRKDGTLLCQCHFGQSRSAAVAAAVQEYFYHSGIEIFADEQERYYPNVHVFRLVLQALRNREAERGPAKGEDET